MRQLALDGAWALASGLPGLVTSIRDEARDIASDEMPALVMEDGDEAEDSIETSAFRVVQEIDFTILLHPSQATSPVVSEWYGKLRAAFAADPTLGGLVESVRFARSTKGTLTDPSTPAHVAARFTFELVRVEDEANPYALP